VSNFQVHIGLVVSDILEEEKEDEKFIYLHCGSKNAPTLADYNYTTQFSRF